MSIGVLQAIEAADWLDRRDGFKQASPPIPRCRDCDKEEMASQTNQLIGNLQK